MLLFNQLCRSQDAHGFGNKFNFILCVLFISLPIRGMNSLSKLIKRRGREERLCITQIPANLLSDKVMRIEKLADQVEKAVEYHLSFCWQIRLVCCLVNMSPDVEIFLAQDIKARMLAAWEAQKKFAEEKPKYKEEFLIYEKNKEPDKELLNALKIK